MRLATFQVTLHGSYIKTNTYWYLSGLILYINCKQSGPQQFDLICFDFNFVVGCQVVNAFKEYLITMAFRVISREQIKLFGWRAAGSSSCNMVTAQSHQTQCPPVSVSGVRSLGSYEGSGDGPITMKVPL